MRRYAALLSGSVLLLAWAASTPARAEAPGVEAAEPGARLALATGRVELLAPEADAWRPAEPNLALQPGDRLRSGDEARVEVQFEGGSVVRLGAASEAELLAVGRDPAVRLVAGRLFARAPRVAGATLAVEAGARTIAAADRAAFRVDVRPDGGADIAATAGAVSVASGGESVTVARGERLAAGAASPEPTTLLARDDFDRWNSDRDAALARSYADRDLPEHLPGLADLETHGSWVRTADHGWAWRPHVAAGWRPYAEGRWVHRPYYGWVWHAAEPWGWTPYHYGRWAPSGVWGWIWIPGPVFATVVVGAPYVIPRPVHAPPVVIYRPIVVHRPVYVRPPHAVPPAHVGRPPHAGRPPVIVDRPDRPPVVGRPAPPPSHRPPAGPPRRPAPTFADRPSSPPAVHRPAPPGDRRPGPTARPARPPEGGAPARLDAPAQPGGERRGALERAAARFTRGERQER
jgi:hypothetical protein